MNHNVAFWNTVLLKRCLLLGY